MMESVSDAVAIAWLDSVGAGDSALVGGKAASLGELRHALSGTGAIVPEGFAVTAHGYRMFVQQPSLALALARALDALSAGKVTAAEAARAIRAAMEAAPLPAPLSEAIGAAYVQLCGRRGGRDVPVAVRSSATAEDQPGASFAGQHASYLGVVGREALLEACRACFASLYTGRAMEYRASLGLRHTGVALAIAVHAMVAWPVTGAAGVMFTIDPETGFPGAVVINGSWGVGEAVVQGLVTPDEFVVFKASLERAPDPVIARRLGNKPKKLLAGETPGTTTAVDTTDLERSRLCLSDAEAVKLARWATTIERHYGVAMDIEWARDGATGEMAIVQARPETVHAGHAAEALRRYTLTGQGTPLVRGISVGSAVASGPARVVASLEGARLQDGEVLVTSATSPDWVGLMRRAAAIVTDLGGRTSHAAIVSRELGVPAVVGTGDATARIESGTVVTVSCAEGREGRVYAGKLAFEVREARLDEIPQTRTKVMMNLAIPDAAFRWWQLPVDGVGLARIEFIISEEIRAHPMALLHPERVDGDARQSLRELTRGYTTGAEYFVDRLAQGIAQIAAAQYPKPAVVRLSDFKSNEYAGLTGGRWFEPPEPNPMLGLRGASRYCHERYREAFALECAALRRVRETMGLTNVVVMIPFCRTVPEADRVLEEMAANGLVRGQDGLRVWLMCEVPSNVVLAADFARRVDGFSIGSNDLTQLVLGVDRDSAELGALFNERDPAVKSMIRSVITTAHANGVTVGFCGQAPSDDPDYAAFLVECGIDSISVNPDAVLRAKQTVAAAERASGGATE
jgi:pyruvate,water dikinase